MKPVKALFGASGSFFFFAFFLALPSSPPLPPPPPPLLSFSFLFKPGAGEAFGAFGRDSWEGKKETEEGDGKGRGRME